MTHQQKFQETVGQMCSSDSRRRAHAPKTISGRGWADGEMMVTKQDVEDNEFADEKDGKSEEKGETAQHGTFSVCAALCCVGLTCVKVEPLPGVSLID